MTSRFLRAVCLFTAILLVGGSRAAWAQDELFVANSGNSSVTVFPRTANGSVTPLRTISGGATGLDGPFGLSVDTVNNEVAVANNTGTAMSLTVYSRSANGNVAPLRTIQGAATGLGFPIGVVVDTVNNEIVADSDNLSVTVYSRTANGNVAPLRTISGGATGLISSQLIAVDPVNNEIVVADAFGSDSIKVYSRTANGNVAPLRILSGGATGLSVPHGVFVDTVNNELVVANRGDHSVRVYGRTANGNVAPLRIIGGAATGLNGPTGLAVDTINNEIVVASSFNNTVRVYSRTANGNVAPLRVISSSGLQGPLGLGISIGPAPGAVVPTLDSRGLIALTLLLAAIGAFAIRRMSL